jgi:maltose O-acetyltransferase
MVFRQIWKLKRYYNISIEKIRIYFYRRQGIKIGKDFSLSKRALIDVRCPSLIEIGDNVNLTRGAMILCTDVSQQQPYFRKYFKGNGTGKVRIGSRVFIGANSIILPGITIGDDVIIGALSVVTKDIPSKSIVAGNPAKLIRKLN